MFPIRMKRTPAEKEAIYALPLHVQFRIVYMHPESDFAVYQHLLVDTQAPDYTQILAVAKAYTAETDCWINPEIMPQAVAARQKLYPGITDNSNPDLNTRYGYVDVKSPRSKNNIVINANRACKQDAMAIITDLELKEGLSMDEAIKFTARIFSDKNVDQTGKPNYTKNEVHWLIKGNLIKCNKPRKS